MHLKYTSLLETSQKEKEQLVCTEATSLVLLACRGRKPIQSKRPTTVGQLSALPIRGEKSIKNGRPEGLNSHEPWVSQPYQYTSKLWVPQSHPLFPQHSPSKSSDHPRLNSGTGESAMMPAFLPPTCPLMSHHQ